MLLKTLVDVVALDAITGPHRVPGIFQPSLVSTSTEIISRSAAIGNGCYWTVPQPSLHPLSCSAGRSVEVFLNCEWRESADDQDSTRSVSLKVFCADSFRLHLYDLRDITCSHVGESV